MMFSILPRQRRFNWLRSSRLNLSLNVTYKLHSRLIKKIMHGSGLVGLSSAISLLLARDVPLIPNHTIRTQFKSRCSFSGTARGIRYCLSRLKILQIGYTGGFGSFGTARW